MKLSKILVFSELASALPELCSGANTLAEETVAVVLGPRSAAEQTAQYASTVLWLGEQAEGSMVEDYVPALAELAAEQSPNLILIRSTRRGKCVAGRLAVRLNAGVCSDAASIEALDAHTAVVRHMVYGGAATAADQIKTAAGIALVGSGVFDAQPLPAPGSVQDMPKAPAANGVVCKAVNRKEDESVDLGAAKRVVSAGRGVGSKENLAILEALAKKIGAEMACSRPIAEGEHWMAKNRYVGVSGAMIKPDVYIACGISGQIQHLVGINGAKTVIAINKDKNAPIFNACDYGIVGDLNKVVPALTELL